MISFNNRLRELRETRDISQQTLADRIGISKSSINMYERGEREPGLETLEIIADFFNVDMDYLLGKSEYQNKTAWLMANGPTQPTPTTLSPEQREYLDKYYTLNHEGKGRVHATIDYEFAKQHGAKKVVSEIIFPPETVTLTEFFMPVCAGTGNYLDDNIEHEERKVLKNKYTYDTDYIIPLQGDSMEPEFHDGDRLIVTDARGEEPIFGRVGIFVVDGAAFLRQPLDGRLHPYNNKYDDIVPSEYTDVRYVGYVVGIIDDSWVVG